MPDGLTVRETILEDLTVILELYPLIFPDEDLQPLVSDLLGGKAEVLSLGAFKGDRIVAHALFTLFGDEGGNGKGALLGPLGVLPDHQGDGIGSNLVKTGLERLATLNIRQVFVLGDPAYYTRFGFQPERHVLTPHPIREEWRDAWQSVLLANAEPLAPGNLRLPEPWMDAALWS